MRGPRDPRDLFEDDEESKEEQSSDFAKMFEESLGGSAAGVKQIERKLSVGDRVKGEILSVGKEEVFVSTGTVDDGVVMKSELLDGEGQFAHKVGDVIDLFVVQVRNGQNLLSPKPTAKNLAEDLEDAFDMMVPVEGRVTEPCNGGFRVNINGKNAFCPISQMDNRRVDDPALYIGKKFEFIITQFSERGRNIVVSRRKLLDEQKELSQAAFAEDHKPGDVLKGVVTRLEKFGAFIEIAPGLEGLCHISELSWSRVNDPSEAVKIGQDVSVKLLKIEDNGGRMNVSLSLKQASEQPWENRPASIEEGKVVEGRVTRCMKFGAFVEVAPGIEGLVPLSEMSYTKRVMRSDELFKEGDRIPVMIKEIREDERRLLLSFKDGQGGDPWATVTMKFPEGSLVRGRVERREAYGIFVKLGDGIVGLMPKSKALENAEFPYEKLKIGDEVTVQVAEIKEAERRISLGAPQDPDAEAWRGFSGDAPSAASAKSLGTLGDQFKGLFDSSKKK